MAEYKDINALNANIEANSGFVKSLTEGMSRTVVGQAHLTQALLIGLLSDGHILLEGVPGLAKTLAIRTLASLIDADFGRIQFTPDLLPADVVGTLVYSRKDDSFNVRRGPIFANFVLADEINRAPAKVQSALLQAMQERQVTIGDDTMPLPDPFLVLATQNPIEQEGTYTLPEAQTDRFMLKVLIDYPSLEEEQRIVRASMSGTIGDAPVTPVVDLETIRRARELVKSIYVDERIEQYVTNLVFATRYPVQYTLDQLEPYIAYGGSPRASISLALAARSLAFLNRRGYVVPDDVRSIAGDVLRHRIGLTYEAEAAGITPDEIIGEILSKVEVPSSSRPMDEQVQQLMQRVRRIEIKTRALSDNVFAGQYHSAFKGRGMSFAEVREYQPGDDVRDIDWNVSARFDRTYVKVYEEERELTVMLLIDVSGSLEFGSQERTQRDMITEIAATLAFSAIRNNDKIGVLFFSDRVEKFIPPAKGKGHILRIIRELLTLIPTGRRTDIGRVLEYFMRITKRQSVAFLLSDFIDDKDYSRQLAMASRRHDVVALQVFDRRLSSLPDVGLMKWEDAETGHRQYVDTSSAAVRNVYSAHWNRRMDSLRQLLNRNRVDHIEISTADDYIRSLKALFAKRAR